VSFSSISTTACIYTGSLPIPAVRLPKLGYICGAESLLREIIQLSSVIGCLLTKVVQILGAYADSTVSCQLSVETLAESGIAAFLHSGLDLSGSSESLRKSWLFMFMMKLE